MAILTYVFRSNKVFNMDTCTSQPITVERGSSAARRDAATRMAKSRDNPLGKFLQDRRAKLDPTAFGFEATHRRTPGLRREEIALRARISPTWYTWLEQGRGGVPSADVLDRIACAFALAPVEREHLFLLAQRRLPEVRYRAPGCVTPRLQRMLDALEFSPAFVKTPTWDVLAWNRAPGGGGVPTRDGSSGSNREGQETGRGVESVEPGIRGDVGRQRGLRLGRGNPTPQTRQRRPARARVFDFHRR
jgi:transcriptional regulator with XRE-family HTH domain